MTKGRDSEGGRRRVGHLMEDLWRMQMPSYSVWILINSIALNTLKDIRLFDV